MNDLIKKLVEAWGPSGFEHQVRNLIREEVKEIADEVRVDALGNLVCRVGEAREDGLRVMVAAHMDEIGVMVSHIDKDGFLRFQNMGGVLQAELFGNRVKFENGTIGVIGLEDCWKGHRLRLPTYNGFYIDVSSGKDEIADVQVGDPAIFWRTMDEQGSRLIAKSMDDRIGCAVAIATMRQLKGSPHEVNFVFTVQEEVGVRGAQTSAFGVAPDLGIALDVTPTGDVPKNLVMDVNLGDGVAIKLQDTRHIVPPAVRNLLIKTAEAHDIPYQREILNIGSTDASAIQLTQSGVPSAALSIPCRYVHTVSEMVDINDVQATVDLLTAVLSNPIENVMPV